MNFLPHICIAAALVGSVIAADSITLPTHAQLAKMLKVEPERIHRTPKEGSIERGSAKIVEYLVGPMSYTLTLSVGKAPANALAISERYTEDGKILQELLFRGPPEGMAEVNAVHIDHIAKNRPVVLFLNRESSESTTTKETMTWWLSEDKKWMVSLASRAGAHPSEKHHQIYKPVAGEFLLAKELDRILFGFPAATDKAEQVGAGQPATRSESDPEGGDKPQPELEGRPR